MSKYQQSLSTALVLLAFFIAPARSSDPREEYLRQQERVDRVNALQDLCFAQEDKWNYEIDYRNSNLTRVSRPPAKINYNSSTKAIAIFDREVCLANQGKGWVGDGVKGRVYFLENAQVCSYLKEIIQQGGYMAEHIEGVSKACYKPRD
jgi:hypothetical protein